MGKSRSATCIAAFLMQKYNISPSEAIDMIRQARPIAEPNDGFMQQLELYHQMQMTHRVEESPIYQRWLYQREVQLSSQCGQAPDADKIRFEDEHVDERSNTSAPEKELRCKKCRYVRLHTLFQVLGRAFESAESALLFFCRTTILSDSFNYLWRVWRTEISPNDVSRPSSSLRPLLTAESHRRALATSAYFIPHQQPPHNKPFPDSLTCAHHFLDPLSWMRPELEQGNLDGRLECPKCKTNVGKYAWQGMRCSCGAWIVPAITLVKGKVDEVRVRNPAERGRAERKGPGVGLPVTRAEGRGLL